MNVNRLRALPLGIFIFCAHCQLDYSSFSNSTVRGQESTLLSHQDQAGDNMVYCNKFNTKGFSGTLTAYYDLEENSFNNNKAQLYLWKVPEEFSYPPTNYIQLHSFRIEENQEVFNKTPINIELITKAEGSPAYLIKSIDHRLLAERGGISIDKFLNSYVFILEGIRGWQGLTFSVFNEQDKPIKVAQVLIPPFVAHPRTYLNRNNNERFLLKLHPFESLLHTKEGARTFYEKGLDFCKSSDVDFDIPKFKEQGPANLDQLLDEFSFLPE